jgi:Tfp pilus assembly protein PilN
MKTKYAIGIAVNGNEIRAAFLSLVRGKACIEALESTKLDEPLENLQQPEKAAESINDLEKAFDINEPQLHEEEADSPAEKSPTNNNISLLYSLVDRFQHIKASVGVNTPVLTVKYDLVEQIAAPKAKDLKSRIRHQFFEKLSASEEDGVRRTKFMPVSEGKVLQIDYEYHPPIIDLVEELNQFRAGNLNLVLMDTNELALVDLVGEIYKFKKDEITAIVYIEQDFSRVIFLKGKNVFHITPIIHKGSMSKDILEVIYSRMLFAQDHYFIPEINKILVAGHSSKLKAKYYFRQKFPYAITGYLNSKKIQSHLRFKDRGMLFSRYAIAIALAWKALQKPVIKSKAANFLPDYLMERNRIPRLELHGYALLFLLALTAFSFTWMLVNKNMELRKVTRRVEGMKNQIASNQSLTEEVKSYDGQIIDLEKKIKVVESYMQGYEATVAVLDLLNQSVRSTGEIWLTDLRKQNNKLDITGVSRRREQIPTLANALGGANLKKVTRSDLHGEKVFTFQLEKTLEEKATSASLLTNADHGSTEAKSSNGKAAAKPPKQKS